MTAGAVIDVPRHHHPHHGRHACATGTDVPAPPQGTAFPVGIPGLTVPATPDQLFSAARQLIDTLESAVRALSPAPPPAALWAMPPGWAKPVSTEAAHWHQWHRHARCGCDCHMRRGCDCHTRPFEHHEECRCGHCRPDSCACTCCVCDSDITIRARAGEQRVVPIVIENERRRERDVTLELSPWTTRGGRPAPVQAVITPASATIAPCGELLATVVVRVTGTHAGTSGQAEPAGEPDLVGAMATPPSKGETAPPDVDECLVAYADLRIGGCDIRPLRLAVAVLPRDCETVPVRCACGCC